MRRTGARLAPGSELRRLGGEVDRGRVGVLVGREPPRDLAEAVREYRNAEWFLALKKDRF